MPYKPSFGNKDLTGFIDAELKPNDTFNSLFGNEKNIEKLNNDPMFKALNEEYKKIFKTGYENNLRDGEIQILISIFSNGKNLHEIEYRLFDDLKLFIKHNEQCLLSFVNPELHAFLVRTYYFKKDKNIMAKKSRLGRVAKIIQNLTNKKGSCEALKRFSEILSNL